MSARHAGGGSGMSLRSRPAIGHGRVALVLLVTATLACETRQWTPPSSGSATPSDSAAIAAVLAREEALRLAMVSADTAALGALLSAEYLSTSAVGHTSTRAETILAYGAGLVRVDSAAIRDVDVRAYGTTAVALGFLDWSGQAAGQPFSATARFQRVWVQQADGRWMLVASQLTGQAPGAGRPAPSGRP